MLDNKSDSIVIIHLLSIQGTCMYDIAGCAGLIESTLKITPALAELGHKEKLGLLFLIKIYAN